MIFVPSQLWEHSKWRNVYCMSQFGLPSSPARPDTEALSQGCVSARLFRDNGKALNPPVDLTFVPSIFKTVLCVSRVVIQPLLGGLGVCLGRGDSRSPPLFGLATPQPPHSCRQNPSWSTRSPKSLCGVCYGGGELRRKEKKREKNERFTFVWGRLWGFEVWPFRHVTFFQTWLRRLPSSSRFKVLSAARW